MTALDTIKQAILGVPFDPDKQPSRVGVVQAFAEMQTQLEGAQAGALIRDTRANLNALVAAPVSAMAWVTNDGTQANNGIYQNTGTAIAAVWTRRTDLPQFVVSAINVGAGTANAIQATTDRAIPVLDGRCLILLPIVTDTTSESVTVSLNGGVAMPVLTNSGNQPSPGGLSEDMIIAGYIFAGTFRMISDQASAAIIAEAENWANVAQAYAAEAVAAAGINYQQFGADPTGATSAVAAIREAFALAASSKSEVRPLPGIFLIDEPIVIPEKFRHIAPKNCIYINSTGTPANPMFINGAIGGTFLLRTANSDIYWEGGTFDAQDTITECLAIGKMNNLKIHNVRFENVRYSHFIETNGVATAEITNCTFVNMTDPGGTRSYAEAINIDFAGNYDQFPFWNAASFDKTVCLNIKVTNCTFVDCLVSVGAHGYTAYGDGTFTTRSQFINISGNTHLNNGVNTVGIQSDAIHCDGFFAATISHNIVNNCKNNGVRMEECISASVTGNDINTAGGNGIFIVGDATDSQSISISGNTVRSAFDVVRAMKSNNLAITGNNGFSLRNGVWLEECDNSTVVGNTFEACSARGVYLNGASNRNTISGNLIRNTAEANIELEGGTFNTVTGNGLSLPASGKPNVKVNGGSTGLIANNTCNGATLSEHFKVTGSATHYSFGMHHCQGTSVSGIVIDSGCDNILYNNLRFDGTYSGTIVIDNGTASVVGTNWTT